MLTYIILIVIIILGILIYKYNMSPTILWKDISYYYEVMVNKSFYRLLDNNKLAVPINKKNKILIITMDNRPNLEYIKLHNKSVQQYVNKHGYEYIYLDKCYYDVYWCKLYLVLKYLQTNKYDYVMWIDSDAVINDNGLVLNDLVNSYSSDIFVSDDNFQSTSNAGIFMIKNSIIGKQFLIDTINNLDIDCLTDNRNKLRGMWSATCYEQGQMFIQIHNKYSKYTTLISNKIFYNGKKCNEQAFIIHLYGSPNMVREKCFKKMLKI
jgi:hypothetical protein